MSIWVRLVGSDWNGRVVKIDDDQVEIVKTFTAPAPVNRILGRSSLIADTIELNKTRYTRRQLRVEDKVITFFAVEALSDFDALNHVLGP